MNEWVWLDSQMCLGRLMVECNPVCSFGMFK